MGNPIAGAKNIIIAFVFKLFIFVVQQSCYNMEDKPKVPTQKEIEDIKSVKTKQVKEHQIIRK